MIQICRYPGGNLGNDLPTIASKNVPRSRETVDRVAEGKLYYIPAYESIIGNEIAEEIKKNVKVPKDVIFILKFPDEKFEYEMEGISGKQTNQKQNKGSLNFLLTSSCMDCSKVAGLVADPNLLIPLSSSIATCRKHGKKSMSQKFNHARTHLRYLGAPKFKTLELASEFDIFTV